MRFLLYTRVWASYSYYARRCSEKGDGWIQDDGCEEKAALDMIYHRSEWGLLSMAKFMRL